MIDRFQGDPKLTLDENGADMVFKGGQPEMDRGLENAVMISLFTKKNWFGNVLLDSDIGSDFIDKLNQPITLSSLNDMSNAGNRALQWMIDTKLASNIKVVVRNPNDRLLQVFVLVEPPTNLFLIEKNGLNWQAQKLDPAYLRMN